MKTFLGLLGVVVGGTLIALGMAREAWPLILAGFLLLPWSILWGMRGGGGEAHY